MSHNRRHFIRKIGLLSAGAGLLPVTQLSAAETKQKKRQKDISEDDKSIVKLNILQTTDVHCQIHPHDELFWENDKAVFRRAGGYAHFASFVKKERKKYTQ